MGNELSALNRRSLLVLGAASLTLSACSNVIGPPDASQIYVLRPAMPAALAGQKVAWTLAVELPDAPENLDSNRIAISRSATTADYYAGAVWSDKLTDIVQGTLVEALEASGVLGEVVRDTEGVTTDYLLKVDVRDFEARYDRPEGPPVFVVAMQAKLIDRRSREVAGHHFARHESAASQDSIDQAVQAAGHALSATLEDIVQWTASAIPAGSAQMSAPAAGQSAVRHRRHRSRH